MRLINTITTPLLLLLLVTPQPVSGDDLPADSAPTATPSPTPDASAPSEVPAGSPQDIKVPLANDEGLDESNLGHYFVGGFEYFAEEPTFSAAGKLDLESANAVRKRLFLLPRVVLEPDGIDIWDQEGSLVTSQLFDESRKRRPGESKQEQEPHLMQESQSLPAVACTCSRSKPCTCATPSQKATYSASFRFTVRAASVNPLVRYVVASHYLNRYVDTSVIDTSRPDLADLLPFYDPLPPRGASPDGDGERGRQLNAFHERLQEVDDMSSWIRFEQVSPRSLAVSVICDGNEISRKAFPSSAYVSSASRIQMEAKGLSASIAKRIASGHFAIQADMQIGLTRQQLAYSSMNLNRLNSFFAKEFASRDTRINKSSRGFLFWTTTEQAVNTFVSRESGMQGASTSGESFAIDLRDADSGLRERAFDFLFERQTGGPELLDDVIKKHLQAAQDSRASNEERDAHAKYADYLKTLKTGDGDPVREKNALEALATLAGSISSKPKDSGQGVSNGIAVAAAGNPYLAVATFLLNGVVWMDVGGADRFQASYLQQSNWTDQQSKAFTAAIQSQRVAGFTVMQSGFPQVDMFLDSALKAEADGSGDPWPLFKKAIRAKVRGE